MTLIGKRQNQKPTKLINPDDTDGKKEQQKTLPADQRGLLARADVFSNRFQNR
jgi:hypothetical protein